MTGGANAIYDTGSVWVTVNGAQKAVNYGQGSTSASVATALRDAINADGGYPVSAALTGATITLTAKTSGVSTNYSLSSGSSTSQPGSFSQPSFSVSPSGSALTGGSDGTAPTYDSGSVWVTVNSVQKSVSYGQGSTNTSVATALRDAINADSGYPVTAFLSGATIHLTAKTAGASTNYSLSGGSSTAQPGSFGQPSFTVATSGSALIGGSEGGSTSAATAIYLHTDHLGSTRVCTNSSGAAAGTCDFEPFGEIQPGTTCSVPTNFRFAGMQWDADAGPNGLYHTWFRQYDSNQARWMAVDPLAGDALDPQSLDRFAYALNDPANFTDPLGLAVFEGGRLNTEFLYNGLSVGADFLVDTGILKFWDIINLSLWSRQLGESLWVSDINSASILALLQDSSDPCADIAGKGGIVSAKTSTG
ncbi:MAG: RHS repeat-associated core domain-containing protein, partial [Longimicrobiales bacterium]